MKRILFTILILQGLLCHAVTYEFKSTSSMSTMSGRNIQITEVGSVSPIQYGTTADYNGYAQTTPYKAQAAERSEWDGYEEYNGVRVYWKVTRDVFGIYFFTITYSDGSSEKYRGLFDEAGAIAHAKESAMEKAKEQAMAMPIGSPTLPVMVIVGCYVAYKSKRKNLKDN